MLIASPFGRGARTQDHLEIRTFSKFVQPISFVLPTLSLFSLKKMTEEDNPGKGTHPQPQMRGTCIESGFSLSREGHWGVSSNVRGVYDVNKASLRLRCFIYFVASASVGLAVLTRVFAGHDGDEMRVE
jgi:hypothetical protein